MRYLVVFIFNLVISIVTFCQTLPSNRSVNWSIAGLKDTSTINFTNYYMNNYGVIGDGVSPNDSVLNFVNNLASPTGKILIFPQGNFLFHSTINLEDSTVLRGLGSDSTIFTFNLGGSGHSIKISGNTTNDTTYFLSNGFKDSSYIEVNNTSLFSPGDWVRISQNDSNLVTSSWAYGTVGQIIKIKRINNNRINFESPLRRDYSLLRNPFIKKIMPKTNVGIECIKIHRLDSTSPQQTSNIFFNYAINSWVKGVESENCTYSHIDGRNSSNLSIIQSYFHHGFTYGGGGRAYGVMLHATANECLVENNIFEHLRHSMIVQSGANGNVFSYNYSTDPHWDSSPNNAAGDMVLHGNYPYSNLFEQNICRNIVIDNSHGPNGEYNTFLRNRAEGYGIFFSANNSPNQNIIGNDISNTTFPYNLVNYTISGNGHFLYGNNNKGTIDPAGTNNLPDLSYFYSQQPSFISTAQWAGIGTPNVMSANNIPSYDRFNSTSISNTNCSSIVTSLNITNDYKSNIYPNPTDGVVNINTKEIISRIIVFDVYGSKIVDRFTNRQNVLLDLSSYSKGIYFIKIIYKNNSESFSLIKN